MRLGREDRYILILQYLAASGPKNGRDIAHYLEKEHQWTVSFGTLYADLRNLREEGWVKVAETKKIMVPKLFGKGERETEDRLFDIDRDRNGKRWHEKVGELQRAKERLGRGSEDLGGLSPA